MNSMKKKMLIVLLSIVAVLLLLVLLINVLTRYTVNGNSPKDEMTFPVGTLEFSDEYITDRDTFLADERYLAYDRTYYYLDLQTGVTEGIEDYDDFGGATELLCKMLDAVIAGDADTYNTFFSDIYFEKNEEKSEFSMQKLYDILITLHSESEIKDVKGNTYHEYILAVEYKIRRNNGSFRSDVDSDGNRTQYFLITDRSGALQIDGIYSYGNLQ